MKEQTIKRSIRWKLLTTMIGLIVVLLTVLTFIQISSQKEVFEKELENRISLMKERLIDRGRTLSDNLYNQVQKGIAEFNFSNISEVLRKSVDGDRELHYAILMDTSRVAYIHTLKHELESETLSEKEDLLAASREKPGIYEYKKNAESFIEFIVPVQMSTEPWGVLRLGFSLELLNKEIVNSRVEIAGQTRKMIARSLITAIIFIILGAGIVLLISNKLSQPLVNLTKVANELARGNFAAGMNIEARSGDEIGVLAAAFAGMSRDLKISYEKQEGYNQTLEQKVAKRTIELAEARDQAVYANKSKSAFLSNMSHELRTPLNSILGFSQLMDTDKKDPLTKFQKENLDQITKSGQHLLDLINEILDLSKIESGKLTISLDSISIRDIINEVFDLMEPLATKYRVTIIDKIAKKDDAYIMADLTRIKQVLINLISNAIKYNKPSGAVTISKEYVSEEIVRISIEDTGKGIPEANIPKLFEPFNRLGAEALEVEGTGIGLTITKKLMELMGGKIGVESDVGKGSRFFVDMKKGKKPVIEIKETDISSQPDSKTVSGEKTVLYIEDNPANLKLVQKILNRRSNIKMLSSPDAKTGIELAMTHKPDLILMDINLPGMDGYEALNELRALDETNKIPVIAVSANAMEGDIQKGKKAGFVEYLTKPINVKNFLESVDKVIGNTGES